MLAAAFLGWLFDGYEIGLFPVVARPALRHLLADPGDALIGQWMGVITACFLVGAAGGGLVFGWLELVAEKGELARSEAKFYLAKDYSRWNEKQYAKSLKLFEELKREYPHNPLWPMLIGSLHFKLEKRQKGEEIYREVYQSTAGKKSEVDEALHKAAREALRRLHPDQNIECIRD